MACTMYDYIQETPSACGKILSNRKNIFQEFVLALKSYDIKRVVVIACGSSYNASVSARLFMEKYLKIPVTLVTPLMYLDYETFYSRNDLFLAVSESGRSALTIDAVRKAVSQGYHCMVMTNNSTSPITRECPDILDLSCGIETVGYVTKGYTATVLDLMLMSLEGSAALKKISAEEYQKALEEISLCVRMMPDVIRAADSWYQENKEQLLRIKRLMVIGFGPNVGTALEGALKVQETLGLPSTPFELEDFMHGPNLELSPTHTAFFIDTEGKAEKRLLDLEKYVEKITTNSYMITHGEKDGNPKNIHISHSISEEVSTLFMAIPFQVLAYRLCESLGIDLNSNVREADNIFNISKLEAEPEKI